MDDLTRRINQATLTKTQKKIAEFILDHASDACFYTTMEIARQLEISEASVVRFSRSLGFSGFMDFQKMLRKEYQERVTQIPNTITVPSQRILHSMANDSDAHLLLGYYQNTTDNLTKLMKETPMASIERAAKHIIDSSKKYIMATRGNAALGDYFLLYLKHMLPGVETIVTAAISPIDHMSSITKEDCLILFSFPRYSTLDMAAARMAADAGASIIVITDKPSADLAKYATVLLIAPVDSNAFFNSLIAPQFVSEVLLSVISHRVEGIESRLEKIDRYLEDIGAY